MGILNSKIRSWSLPQLLLNTELLLLLLLMHIIIKELPHYYISNKGLLEEFYQEEHVEVNGTATTFCLERRF
jgi:hypothetical protein